MNLDTLNQTETLFTELSEFYYSWNADHEAIISYLIEQPTTKHRMNVIQQKREILFNERLPPPRPFKFSDQDVFKWVYEDRIIPLQEQYLTLLNREIKITKTDAEERSRTAWCKDFQELLNNVATQITTLEHTSVDGSNKLANDEEADWLNIQVAMKVFATNHIKPLIAQFSTIINRYLPTDTASLQPTLRANKQPTQSAKDNPPKYSQFSDLFKDAITMAVGIDALRKIDFPTINEKGEWIGGRKRMFVIVAWIERMEYCSLITYVADRELLVKLLNGHFPNLKMGGKARTFGNKSEGSPTAEAEFAALILR